MYKVILIGGTPYTGKTTLAKLLSAKLGYSNISTDDLGSALRAVLPDDPAFNPNGSRSYEDYYLQETNEKLISDTERHHSRLKPAVMHVIDSHLHFSGPAVIEGWSMFPLWFDNDNKDLGKIWLVSDPDTIYDRIVNDDFFSGHSDRKKIIKKYSVRCFWQNRRIEEEAVHTHQPIIRVGMSTTPEELLSKTIGMLEGK
jgi:2-phosphoglycerate kinase